MTRAQNATGLTVLALVAACPAAAAQREAARTAPTTRIEQIPPAAPPPAAEPPLPAPDVRAAGQLSRPEESTAATQLTGTGAWRGALPQLNPERRSARAAPQLTRGKPSAQVADPLSSPAQSRPAAVVRLDGRDRCDPADPRTAARPDCRRVIETRAGEFTRANPLTLSPEQRLMVDQRLRQLPTSAESAVQRIGRNEVDATDTDAQSVASLVLPATRPSDPTTKAEDTPAGLDAEVLSVIQALAGATPTTPVVTPP